MTFDVPIMVYICGGREEGGARSFYCCSELFSLVTTHEAFLAMRKATLTTI